MFVIQGHGQSIIEDDNDRWTVPKGYSFIQFKKIGFPLKYTEAGHIWYDLSQSKQHVIDKYLSYKNIIKDIHYYPEGSKMTNTRFKFSNYDKVSIRKLGVYPVPIPLDSQLDVERKYSYLNSEYRGGFFINENISNTYYDDTKECLVTNQEYNTDPFDKSLLKFDSNKEYILSEIQKHLQPGIYFIIACRNAALNVDPNIVKYRAQRSLKKQDIIQANMFKNWRALLYVEKVRLLSYNIELQNTILLVNKKKFEYNIIYEKLKNSDINYLRNLQHKYPDRVNKILKKFKYKNNEVIIAIKAQNNKLKYILEHIDDNVKKQNKHNEEINKYSLNMTTIIDKLPDDQNVLVISNNITYCVNMKYIRSVKGIINNIKLNTKDMVTVNVCDAKDTIYPL